ncbi:hypothetical protein [Streptomyces atratus]|nr:hypothetical protein [Streptomyces atratus]
MRATRSLGQDMPAKLSQQVADDEAALLTPMVTSSHRARASR